MAEAERRRRRIRQASTAKDSTDPPEGDPGVVVADEPAAAGMSSTAETAAVYDPIPQAGPDTAARAPGTAPGNTSSAPGTTAAGSGSTATRSAGTPAAPGRVADPPPDADDAGPGHAAGGRARAPTEPESVAGPAALRQPGAGDPGAPPTPRRGTAPRRRGGRIPGPTTAAEVVPPARAAGRPAAGNGQPAGTAAGPAPVPAGHPRAQAGAAGAPVTGNGDERETERGLRGLVGSGASQVSVGAAMRARDASRPTEDDLAAAQERLVIVRRNWVPRDDAARNR